MKIVHYLFAAVALLGTNLVAQQGPPEGRPARPSPAQRQERRQQPREDGAREHQQPGMHWLRQLEETDPELFAKVQRMRREDPQAFAHWMRARMIERRRDTILERHPAFAAFLESLPQSDRESLESDLFQLRRPDGRSHEPPSDATQRPRAERKGPPREHMEARTRYFEQEIERAEERIKELRVLLEKRRELLDTMPED